MKHLGRASLRPQAWLSGLLAGMVVLAACAPAAAPSPTAAPAKPGTEKPAQQPAAKTETKPGAKAAAPSGEPIVIGGTLPLTGQFSGAAKVFDGLASSWAEMVNEAGGIKMGNESRPIKFIIYDDASDQAKAVQLYEKLVTEDKVDMLIGPYSSPMTFAASTVAEKHQIPFVAVEANSDAIYTRDFKWIVGVLDTGRNWANQHFDMLKADGRTKTVGIVTQENLHTKEVRESAVNNAERVGIQVLVDETLPANAQDFGPVIARLKQATPDMVYVSSFEAFGAPFVKQARELGLNPKALHIIHHGGFLLDAVGKDAEQVTGEHYWLPGLPGEGIEEFEELQKRSDVPVDKWPWAAIRFPAYQVIRAGLEKAGTTDRTKLMESFKSLEVDTLAGKIKFDKDGRGTMNPYPTQIQNGEYVLVWPKEYTKGEWIFPRNVW